MLFPEGDRLIAGGGFSRIGDRDFPGLAAWDGSRWSAIGDFPGGLVSDLAPYGRGLVAMGSLSPLWRWNGTQWSALPELPSWAIQLIDMAVSDDRIAVSVWLAEYSPGNRRSRVLLFDGKSWSPLGGEFSDGVSALEWYQGELFAGGYLLSLDGVPMGLARWDGSAWQPAVAGLPQYAHVRSLAIHGNNLVAGGLFAASLPITPTTSHSFEAWNGASWSPLGADQPWMPNIQRFRSIGQDLYAVGNLQDRYRHGIVRWDGSAWHAQEDSLDGNVYDVAWYRDGLYAGGYFSVDGTRPAAPVVRRRGGNWEPLLLPRDSERGLTGWAGPEISALDAVDNGIIAGGRIDVAGSPGGWLRCYGTARWDGTRWSQVGGRWSSASVLDMTWHDGSLYALGHFSGPSTFGRLARYEAGEWRLVSQPPILNAYNMTSALDRLFVGGNVAYGEGAIAQWDGTSWSGVGGGMTRGSWISAMTPHGSDLIVAGEFEEMGGVPCRNIAAWNPSTGWRPLNSGLPDNVTDLTSRDGVLYASTYSGVARWEAGSWQTLSASRFVASLGWYRGRLVASGWDFPGHLAFLELDGTWSPLGSGINGVVWSFLESGPSLFVAGDFSRAGGKAAYGFAEWREDGGPPPFATAPRMIVAPNPSAVAVHLTYMMAVAGPARVEIYDLNGRRVDTLFDGEQSAGPQDLVWTPDPGRVKPGVYFAKLMAGGSTQIVRVARIN